MRNKARFEFVDEFRKINCLEKLMPIDNLHPDDQDEVKQDNNKFIRYKEEAVLEEDPRTQDYLYNPIVDAYKQDIEPDCHAVFTRNNASISSDIDYYQQWSDSLNQEVKQRDYKHRFYFKQAQPPPRLKEDPAAKEKASARGTDDPVPERADHQDTNIDLPQRGKYNFHEITRHLLSSGRGDDKDGVFVRDLTIKNEIAELRKLKNLEQIERIGDFHEEFAKFAYYIETPPDQTDIEFVDNSVVRGNNTLALDYFRDIGTPSRRILDYTIAKEKRMRREDEEGELAADYRLEGRELLYLYFLKEEELKINKAEMTFADMANIAMGRITSNNAHMCVRNEKVTKAQYTKLLKKMEKYDLRENEAGKPKEDRQVGTEELEEMTQNPTGDPDTDARDDKINIEKLIDEINKIRKEVKTLEDAASNNAFSRPSFNNEVYIKLEKLLTLLYDMVTEKMPQKYSIAEIGQHLHEIEGINELGYDRLRILWFVANCYDEMLSKQEKTVDLRSIAAKPAATPQVTRFKGNKLLAQDAIQTKKVYGFNNPTPTKGRPPNATNTNTAANDNTDRSKSPLGFGTATPTRRTRTPIKNDLNKSATSRTPPKQPTTASKLNTSSTARKYPTTAKK